MDYKINFIRNSYIRFAEEHKQELKDAFWNCVSKGDLILREEVSKFEDTLASYVGVKYGIGVGSGTDALFLSLKALGIGEGDEVITVSHTFIASIQGIIHCGATPILIDVSDDELMDVSKIEAAITPRTKAILPVHFHGKVCDMEVIMRLAKNYNLYVIEDACQALGSSYKFKVCEDPSHEGYGCNGWRTDPYMAGSMGTVGCFSFNTPKLLGGWGDGGGIVTDDRKLAEKLYLLRNHYNMAQTSVRIDDFPTPEIVRWGWKSRLDNIQAALLNVKWKYFDQMLARRKQIADMYCAGLKDIWQVHLPQYEDGDVIQEFIINVGGSRDKDREAFKKFMDEKGIELLIRETTPNHKVKLLGLDHFSLPVTENISKSAVRLPSYPELRDDEVKEIIQAVREFYGK